MKKGIKFSLYILGISIGLAIVGWGLVSILNYCGLMFRAWVGIAYFIVMVLLGFALLGGIAHTLVKVYSLPQEEKRKRTKQKVLAVGGIAVTLSGTVVFGLIVLLISVFRYTPEYVIEMYDQKMVAYEEHWHHTRITYHEYKNFLVCGYKTIGYEIVGRYYEFHDTQGNLIARLEEKQNNTQDEEEKEPENSTFPPETMQCNFRSSDPKMFCEMLYSTDGENWKEINTGYHYQFFFENIGYLVFSYDWLNLQQREGAAIYKSIDGGENWIFVSDTPSDELLQNALFFDEYTGIFEYGTAGTDSYLLYVTTDGADTMRQVDLPAELQGREGEIKKYIRGEN